MRGISRRAITLSLHACAECVCGRAREGPGRNGTNGQCSGRRTGGKIKLGRPENSVRPPPPFLSSVLFPRRSALPGFARESARENDEERPNLSHRERPCSRRGARCSSPLNLVLQPLPTTTLTYFRGLPDISRHRSRTADTDFPAARRAAPLERRDCISLAQIASRRRRLEPVADHRRAVVGSADSSDRLCFVREEEFFSGHWSLMRACDWSQRLDRRGSGVVCLG